MMQLCFGIEPKYSLGLADICNTQTLIKGYFESCGSWNPRRGCVAVFSLKVVLPSGWKSFLITHLLRRFQS